MTRALPAVCLVVTAALAAPPARGIIREEVCSTIECGRRFPNGLEGRTVPVNVAISLQGRCVSFLTLDSLFPELVTADGTVIASQWTRRHALSSYSWPPTYSDWVEVSSHATVEVYERTGEPLPEGAEILVRDNWSGACRGVLQGFLPGLDDNIELSCLPDGGADDCCAPQAEPTELFRFRTGPPDTVPPPPVSVQPECVHNVFTLRLVPLISPPADDVVTVEILLRRDDEETSRLLGEWTAPPCLPGRPEREFVLRPLEDARFAFYDMALDQAQGVWNLTAVAVDEAGNRTVGPELEFRVTEDCGLDHEPSERLVVACAASDVASDAGTVPGPAGFGQVACEELDIPRGPDLIPLPTFGTGGAPPGDVAPDGGASAPPPRLRPGDTSASSCAYGVLAKPYGHGSLSVVLGAALLWIRRRTAHRAFRRAL